MIRRSIAGLVAIAVALGVFANLLGVGETPEDAAAANRPSPSITIIIGTRSSSPSPDPTATATPEPTTGPTESPGPSSTPAPAPTAVPTPVTASTATSNALQRSLDRIRARYGVPGISATIIFADGSVWAGTTGLADVAAQVPVTRDTAFAIASASKTFTAAAILALVEEGRIGLDDPVAPHLPDLPIDLDPRITVRQLLDHTSGIFDFFLQRKIDAALLERKSRAWDVVETLGYVRKPYFLPGKGWHYSNTNYLILGLLAEAIDGRPIADQIRDRFLEPLGLDHTWYQSAEEPTGEIARGYRFTGADPTLPAIDISDATDVRPFTSVVTASSASGSIASTSYDLATWARALYRGRVLSPDTVRVMLDDVATTAPFKPIVAHGLGVQVVTIDGRRAIGHTGRLAGFRSVVRSLPDDGITIAVLTNQTRLDPSLIARSLLRVVLGQPG